MNDHLYGFLRIILDLDLEKWSSIAAIMGALVAVVGFPMLAWQLSVARSQRRDAIRLSKSQFLLAADAVLATHVEVAANLRPGGKWAGDKGNTNPTNAELPLVEPYLGVFERMFVAYQEGQVDATTLDDLYGYRLQNIWANQNIVEQKLQNPDLRASWRRVIGLTYVLEAYTRRSFPLHTDSYFPYELFDQRSAREIHKRIAIRRAADQENSP